MSFIQGNLHYTVGNERIHELRAGPSICSRANFNSFALSSRQLVWKVNQRRTRYLGLRSLECESWLSLD